MCPVGEHVWVYDEDGPHCERCPATPLDELREMNAKRETSDEEDDPWSW
jgi:hypothetical protein